MLVKTHPAFLRLQVFDEDQDNGYHAFGTNWWTNPACPFAFQYLSLDDAYPAPYFEPNRGHPSDASADALLAYMQASYTNVQGKPFASVLELGTGAGEIAGAFQRAGLSQLAIEGTSAGFARLREKQIPCVKADLRTWEGVPNRFDLVMCTEVAEHLEPWFAAALVKLCVRHADAVWFSAAPGDAPPHYHHVNEVAIGAWDNLFAFLGMPHYVELDRRLSRADRLYLRNKP
jgi:hypothetical protein